MLKAILEGVMMILLYLLFILVGALSAKLLMPIIIKGKWLVFTILFIPFAIMGFITNTNQYPNLEILRMFYFFWLSGYLLYLANLEMQGKLW